MFLLEREQAIRSIEACLERSSRGIGGSLLLVGEAGLGKTSLLSVARERAAALSVASAHGEQTEQSVPFGLVRELLAGLGEPELLDPPKAEGLLPGPSPHHRVLRFLEARSGPHLVLLLDDLHWSDPDSLSIVAFLVRRASRLRLTIVGALRPWPRDAEHSLVDLVEPGTVAVERLKPLSTASSSSLLARMLAREPTLDEEARTWELCCGNPLLVLQVAVALKLGEKFPQKPGGTAAFAKHLLLSRFAGLSQAGILCAQAASVLGTARPQFAAEVAGIPEAEVEPALEALYRSGLLVQDEGGSMRLSHPLFASALYEDMSPVIRQGLHTRAFKVLLDKGLEEEACEHAEKADLIGDASAIVALERTGRSAYAAGAIAGAVQHLGSALRLSGDRPTPSLVLATAEVLVTASKPAEAARLCAQLVLQPSLGIEERTSALRIHGRALYLLGAPDRGQGSLEEAIGLAAHNPAGAIQPLIDASLSAWLAGGPRLALPLAARAVHLAGGCDQRVQDRARAVWGHIAFESGDPAGFDATEAVFPRLIASFHQGRLDAADLTWPWASLQVSASNLVEAERFEDAERAFRAASSACEAAGAAGASATLSIYIANLLIRRGRLDEALAHADESLELSELTPGTTPYAQLVKAEVLAWLGRLEEADLLCDRIEGYVEGQWFGELWLAHLRGAGCLWRGRFTDASNYLLTVEKLNHRAGIGEPCQRHWAGHAVHAHTGAGRLDDARRVLRWLEERSSVLPCSWPRFTGALGRAFVAEREGSVELAEKAFLRAMAIGTPELQVHRAEALLAFGCFLRRQGRHVEARAPLAECLRLAESVGAGHFVDLASTELRLAGGRRRRAVAAEPGCLTAAEVRVARLAAGGHSNALIGERLRLSVNTVETHLKHVYAKLQIGSRRELMQMAPEHLEPVG